METKQSSHSMHKSDSFEDLFKRSITCLDTMIDDNRVLDDEKEASKPVKEQDRDINIDVADNTQDLEDVTEEELESSFNSFRPYIESCIKLLDLIVFFNIFTPGQVKMFYKLSKLDPANALRQAFDTIVTMNNVPNRFHILLRALHEAEYPKIVHLLRGLLIRVHGKHRQKLKTYAKDMYQRLSVCDILPYLLTKRVINHHDIEEIKSVERTECRGSAVMQLLSILPNRSKVELEEAAMLGIAPPIAKSSLQVSVKGLKKRLARSQSISGLESMGQELVRHLEHAEKNVAGIKIEVVDVDSGSTEEVTGDNTMECGPCKRRNCEVKANQFCIECDENLCHSCRDVHEILRPTQGHKVVSNNDEQNQTAVFEQQLHSNAFYCDCHKNHLVEIYCQNHNVLVCLVCRSTHHENCDTFIMKEQSDSILKQLETAMAQRAEEVTDMLAKLEADIKRDLTKLKCCKDMCSKQILGFLGELQIFLDGLKQKAFENLSKQEEAQRLCITECILSVQRIKQRTNYEITSLKENGQTKDKDVLAALYVTKLNFLRTTKITIDMMQDEVHLFPIMFERNSALDMVKTAVSQLGILKSATVSHCSEQTESFVSVSPEEYPNISDSNSNEPALITVKPDESLNTEASFLKPYYQFIKSSGDSLGWEIVENE